MYGGFLKPKGVKSMVCFLMCEFLNLFRHKLRASLDALAASDPSAAREAQGGYRHGVSGGRAVECDHTALP